MKEGVRRGEIYYIRKAGSEEGSEQRANRPAVIVSNDKNNSNSEVVEVVYMTTKPKTSLPTHFITEQALRKSTVLCEQVNSVSVGRIGEWIGTLSEPEMEKLNECLAISIGVKTEQAEQTEKQTEKTDSIRQQLTEAEKRAATYKGLYEYMLQQQLGAEA